MLDKIIEKMKEYLVSQMGFEEVGDVLSKRLSVEDYCLSSTVVKTIMNGEAYKGMDPYETIQSLLIDNFIGEKIMDTAIYDVDFSDEERAFFESDEDEDDDDFGYNGYCEIESWVNDQNITVDRDELLEFIDAAMNAV